MRGWLWLWLDSKMPQESLWCVNKSAREIRYIYRGFFSSNRFFRCLPAKSTKVNLLTNFFFEEVAVRQGLIKIQSLHWFRWIPWRRRNTHDDFGCGSTLELRSYRHLWSLVLPIIYDYPSPLNLVKHQVRSYRKKERTPRFLFCRRSHANLHG